MAYVSDPGQLPGHIWTNALGSHVRAHLKKILMEVAEEEVENVLDEAMKSLQITADTWFKPEERANVVRFVLEKK